MPKSFDFDITFMRGLEKRNMKHEDIGKTNRSWGGNKSSFRGYKARA